MAALTLKNVPDELLERLRERADRDRRSLNQEVLYLLEQVLDGAGEEARRERVRAQVEEWSRLAGQWRSEESAEEEIEAILSARTTGKTVDL